MFCEFCGKEHDGSYGSGRFCCKSCKDNYCGRTAGQTLKDRNNKPKIYLSKICEKCGKPFYLEDNYYNRKRRFCCRSCANSHKHTPETIAKIQQSQQKSVLNRGLKLRANLEDGKKSQRLQEPRLLTCEICGKQYEYYWHNIRHTCYDPQCRSKYISLKIKQNNNVGGYRKHSGTGKCGWYKNIFCQSSYELAWVIYNIDHDIEFYRCKKIFYYIKDNKQYKYYPDFELSDGTIIELKGYYQPTVSLKEKAVVDQGYKYKILYKQDLQYCFDYIKQKYNVGKNNIITLYDDGKSYIEKTCVICGKLFKTTNDKQQTCCRSCNGKYVQQKKYNN